VKQQIRNLGAQLLHERLDMPLLDDSDDHALGAPLTPALLPHRGVMQDGFQELINHANRMGEKRVA
jgi:hypothetical protein